MRFDAIVVIGLLTTLIGGLGIVGFIPLGAVSGSNIITFGTPTVNCSPTLCTASIPVTNGGWASTYQLYFVVRNLVGQTVSITTQQEQPTPTTFTATQNLPQMTTGTYTINVFATDTSANALSTTASASFNTGQFTFTMNPISSIAGTTTPAAGSQYVAPGATILLTYAPATGYTFQSWFIACDNVPNNPLTPTVNPYTLTVNGNCQASVVQTVTSGGQITVTPTIFGQLNPPQGTFNPSTPQALFSSSGGGQTSVTFTETPTVGYSFVSWQVYGTTITGTSPSITLTYAQLSAFTGTSFQLVATYTSQPILAITTNPNSGITTSPVPGNYPYSVGQQVTITETTASGACFLGWIVQQGSGVPVNMGKAPSITITIQQGSNAVLASGAVQSTGGCNVTPPNAGPPILSWAFFASGLALTGYGGLRRKKE